MALGRLRVLVPNEITGWKIKPEPVVFSRRRVLRNYFGSAFGADNICGTKNSPCYSAVSEAKRCDIKNVRCVRGLSTCRERRSDPSKALEERKTGELTEEFSLRAKKTTGQCPKRSAFAALIHTASLH